jgi:carboxyl-terminal processing protease
MKTNKVFEPMMYALVLCVGLLLGRYTGTNRISGNEGRLMEALKIIENQYVDTVDMEDLSSLAIGEVMQKLDPHSVFIAASEKAQVNAPLDGNFQGIGIEFNVIKDTVFVLRVIDGGPAKKAGISVADRLISANGKSLIALDYDEIAALIKGDKGTKVRLEVWTSKGKLESKIAIRGVVDIPSIPTYYMMNDSLAYLKLDQFSASTTEEFRKAIEEMNDQGMKALIFDLRNNTGGYLQAAIDLLDEFIDGKSVLTYTAGRTESKKEYFSTAGGLCKSTRLVVLVNGQSASASELFSGAIQDYKRGTIMGTQTYGKGLVQESFSLSDGSLLRLTVARYYTPKGRSIQRSYVGLKAGESMEKVGGITPDITLNEKRDSQPEHEEIWASAQRKILIDILQTQSDRLKAFSKTERFLSDPSLLAAIEKGLSQLPGAGLKSADWKKKQSNEIMGSVLRCFLGDASMIRWKNSADSTVLKARNVLLQP